MSSRSEAIFYSTPSPCNSESRKLRPKMVPKHQGPAPVSGSNNRLQFRVTARYATRFGDKHLRPMFSREMVRTFGATFPGATVFSLDTGSSVNIGEILRCFIYFR